MADLELLSIGLINDMYCESRNDSCSYATLATQEDFDLFYLKMVDYLKKALIYGHTSRISS